VVGMAVGMRNDIDLLICSETGSDERFSDVLMMTTTDTTTARPRDSVTFYYYENLEDSRDFNSVYTHS
jgi:hypothetical protein